MVLSEKEPYEDNLTTNTSWKSNSTKAKSQFVRGKDKTVIEWTISEEIFADKLVLFNATKTWKAEFQAMTSDKFHLHVSSLSQKNCILFSGSLTKSKGPKDLIRYFFT